MIILLRLRKPDRRSPNTNSAVKSNSEGNLAGDLENANYLWDEFKYRHDLIWRLLFRITFVTVLLSITPFTVNDSVRARVGSWIYLLPVLAFLLALGGWVLLVKEFWLFQPIDRFYRHFQKQVLRRQVPPSLVDDLHEISRKKKGDIFKLIVFVYPAILLLLILLTFVAFVRTR